MFLTFGYKCRFLTIVASFAVCLSVYANPGASGNELKVDCPKHSEAQPKWPRSKTYNGMPFGPGEEARYELKYGPLRVMVGYGFMRVGKPLKYKIPVQRTGAKVLTEKRWHRVFSVEAYTGDWYKGIFQAHDKLQAFSRPWDFGISKFYIRILN